MSKLLEKYEDWTLKNASQISSIESFLRTLTYILPVFAALNLIGLYHDSILVRASENLPPSKKPAPSSHNRYTRYWINSSKTYQRASLALTFLQYTDVLMEMGVQKKWGKEAKWRLIVLIELFKAICRILLLRKTHERTVINPPIPRREVDPSIFNEENRSSNSFVSNGHAGNLMDVHRSKEFETWTGKYTGRIHDRISVVQKGITHYPAVSDYLMSKVLMVEDVQKPSELVHKLQSYGTLGELLYIIRPLLYVLALRKYGNRSWRPWLLSLSIELVTRIMESYYYKRRIPGGYRWSSSLEKEEKKRRIRQFFFYILRGPFYEQFTKPKINNFCHAVSNKPILSLFGGILRDYQPLWENIYFYKISFYTLWSYVFVDP
ncbi:9632_t:CDS:2 [Acaulospora morrowiae]|uniref:Peroxisomal membrane protein PEX16 n=1 Tax=Acaulospora morrowiae TaxID=94023 RepID=A0A9N9A325_9GLOM|nr:9632_t:CDS:2 [Acaulospora morrowiae]